MTTGEERADRGTRVRREVLDAEPAHAGGSFGAPFQVERATWRAHRAGHSELGPKEPGALSGECAWLSPMYGWAGGIAAASHSRSWSPA